MAGRRGRRGIKKILWIDDDPHTLVSARTMLQDMGFRVDWAETAAEGVRALKTAKYDLLILDCMLTPDDRTEAPLEAGVSLLRRLRQGKVGSNRGNKTTPVIAVTAIASTAVLEEIHRYGVNAVLCKPLFPEAILTAVTESLNTGGR